MCACVRCNVYQELIHLAWNNSKSLPKCSDLSHFLRELTVNPPKSRDLSHFVRKMRVDPYQNVTTCHALAKNTGKSLSTSHGRSHFVLKIRVNPYQDIATCHPWCEKYKWILTKIARLVTLCAKNTGKSLPKSRDLSHFLWKLFVNPYQKVTICHIAYVKVLLVDAHKFTHIVKKCRR